MLTMQFAGAHPAPEAEREEAARRALQDPEEDPGCHAQVQQRAPAARLPGMPPAESKFEAVFV